MPEVRRTSLQKWMQDTAFLGRFGYERHKKKKVFVKRRQKVSWERKTSAQVARSGEISRRGLVGSSREGETGGRPTAPQTTSTDAQRTAGF